MGKALEPTLNTAQNAPEPASGVNEDYSRAIASARIACYDDFRSAPRVTEIAPTTTAEFIENLASTIYTQAQQAGGSIPYTAIREVSENFIHAQFKEIVVSIFDKGNTIRFTDQGPGIPQKDVLYLFLDQPTLRVTDIVEELGLAASSAHRALKKLEEAGLISTVGKMRQVTDEGLRVIDALF